MHPEHLQKPIHQNKFIKEINIKERNRKMNTKTSKFTHQHHRLFWKLTHIFYVSKNHMRLYTHKFQYIRDSSSWNLRTKFNLLKSSRFDKWGRDNSQLFSEILKCYPGKAFSKYINDLFFGGNILQFNLFLKHVFS